ncbi:MAG: RodZ domain-containing protein [Betaproteobacteria bacterium]
MTGTDAADSPPGMAGALLRVARESAGMTIDAVAQQLKLAPRQVKALEDGDYTHLPGRTFVRGFVRNYARLVHLDPDRVLGALPGGAAAPALEAPTLQQTAPTIGELPTTDHSKPGWARWAIPVILAAIVAAAAIYEWIRPAGEPRTGAAKESSALKPAPVPSAAPKDPAVTALPNPLVLSAPSGSAIPAATDAAPAGSATPNLAAPALAGSWGSAGTAALGAGAGDQPVVVTFRDYSWTDIRDREGRVLLSGMNYGGTEQALSGTPPLAVVIGNAADVTLRYRGQPVDLAPHTRQNVARLTLQ